MDGGFGMSAMPCRDGGFGMSGVGMGVAGLCSKKGQQKQPSQQEQHEQHEQQFDEHEQQQQPHHQPRERQQQLCQQQQQAEEVAAAAAAAAAAAGACGMPVGTGGIQECMDGGLRGGIGGPGMGIGKGTGMGMGGLAGQDHGGGGMPGAYGMPGGPGGMQGGMGGVPGESIVAKSSSPSVGDLQKRALEFPHFGNWIKDAARAAAEPRGRAQQLEESDEGSGNELNVMTSGCTHGTAQQLEGSDEGSGTERNVTISGCTHSTAEVLPDSISKEKEFEKDLEEQYAADGMLPSSGLTNAELKRLAWLLGDISEEIAGAHWQADEAEREPKLEAQRLCQAAMAKADAELRAGRARA
uniref:Uncharacterized protein n=1 Tax=Alexandrium catenella TaxID=2925 RepID=A0A7S1KVY6_ALECA